MLVLRNLDAICKLHHWPWAKQNLLSRLLHCPYRDALRLKVPREGCDVTGWDAVEEHDSCTFPSLLHPIPTQPELPARDATIPLWGVCVGGMCGYAFHCHANGGGGYWHLIGGGQGCGKSTDARKSPVLGKICAAQNASGASNEKHRKAMKEVLSGENLPIWRLSTYFQGTLWDV